MGGSHRGPEGVRTECAFVQTAGRSRAARLIKFHSPSHPGDDQHAPANTPGIRHLAFAVDDIEAVLADLQSSGAELVGEVENYEDTYRLCCVRGLEGIIGELAERVG